MSIEQTTLQEVTETPSNLPPPPPVDPVRNTPASEDKTKPVAQRLNSLKQELLQQIEAKQAATTEPAQPVQPQAPDNSQTQPPVAEVPQKFLNPDGTPNVERIQQSTLNLEQALAKYREREAEFTKQRMQTPKPYASQEQATPNAAPEPAAPNTFEAQIEADLAKEGAGKVLAKLFLASKEAAKNETMSGVHGLQQEVESAKRDRELELLAKSDAFLLTQQGVDTLAKIRADKPWLNNSPRPWEAAYRDYLADQQILQRAGSQVQMPNPKGPTAPIAPAGPVNRAPVTPAPNPQEMSKEQINGFLAGKSNQEVAAFMARMGLPWEKRWSK